MGQSVQTVLRVVAPLDKILSGGLEMLCEYLDAMWKCFQYSWGLFESFFLITS